MKLSALIAIVSLAAFAAGCASRPNLSAQSTPPLLDVAQVQETPPTAVAPPEEPSHEPVADPATETPIARYTTLSTQPLEAESNPMAAIAEVHFPRQVVNTVGDAVRYVLIRTGYQLAPNDALDPRLKAVFGFRLPDNQRLLGPYRVDAMLGVLLGKPYKLVTDQTTRTINYIVNAVPAPIASDQPSAPLPPAGSPTTGPSGSVSLARTSGH